MNLDLKQFVPILKKTVREFQRYAGFTFIISVLLIYSFLVFRISQLSSAEPSDDAIAEQSNTIKRLKVDENSLKKIEELKDQNIGVQSLFETARDNPFQE